MKLTDINRVASCCGAVGEKKQFPINGIGETEWKIASTANTYNWLDWKPGSYKIRCTVSFTGGGSTTVEFDQEIGVRTDDIVVLAWIDKAQVFFNKNGVQPALLEVLPSDGIKSTDNDNVKIKAGLLIKRFADANDSIDVPFQIDVDPGPWWAFILPSWLSVGVDFMPFSAADRTYALNWMFKYGSNPTPPDNFIDDNFFSQKKFDEFADAAKKTNYKLLNHYQVKYLLGKR